jgi:hypothetical protein
MVVPLIQKDMMKEERQSAICTITIFYFKTVIFCVCLFSLQLI